MCEIDVRASKTPKNKSNIDNKSKDVDIDDSVFSFMYTNVDNGMLNKKDELYERIKALKPKIIALTERIPKNCKDVDEKEYYISQYDTFLNKQPKRGVAIYTDKALNAEECKDFKNYEAQENVWVKFNTHNDGSILIGCIYRSPGTSDEENNQKIFNMLKDEAMRKYDKICVVGDFNYPFIKWDSSIGEGRAEMILNLLV